MKAPRKFWPCVLLVGGSWGLLCEAIDIAWSRLSTGTWPNMTGSYDHGKIFGRVVGMLFFGSFMWLIREQRSKNSSAAANKVCAPPAATTSAPPQTSARNAAQFNHKSKSFQTDLLPTFRPRHSPSAFD